MNKKIIILLVLLRFYQNGIGQDLIYVDIQNHKGTPIPYVTVSIKDKSNGLIADNKGRFILNTFKESDTLLFSCLGFERKYLTYMQIIENKSKVVISEKVYALDEVVIKSEKIKLSKRFVFTNGTYSDNKFCTMSFGITNAIKINGNKELNKIEQIRFFTKDVCDENNLMRIRIASCDTTNLPLNDLLIDEPITISAKRKSWNTLDISNKSIYIQGDFFVVFESLSAKNDCFKKDSPKNSYNISIASTNEIAEGYNSRFGGKWVVANTITKNNRTVNFVPYIEITQREVINNNQ